MIEIEETDIIQNWDGDINEPVVSIRCTTFNHVNYIEKALDGFLSQKTSYPFEVVVHDDASTDGTTDVIRVYEKKYPQIIKAIYEEENQYSKHDGSLRRIVNSHLRGKYVAWCEGDDYWISHEKLQKQIEYMENNPECTMCFHAANYLKDGKIIKNDLICEHECDISADQIIEGGGDFCATASIVCRRELFLQMPKYRTVAKVGDYPLQIMLATLGTVHYFPYIWSVYRFCSPDSWTVRNKSNDKQLNHWRNEIEWLKVMDDTTMHKYHGSVLYKIFIDLMEIYVLGDESAIKSAKECIKGIPDFKKRAKCRIKLIKKFIKNI